MPSPPTIQFAQLDELMLDPMNPRIGRSARGADVGQDRVLELVDEWALEELAVSFLESGFWPQEAVVVVKEQLYGATHKVVIEGNRRLAALKKLQKLSKGAAQANRKWESILKSALPGQIDALCAAVPYVEMATRRDVQSYLGFRHVSGIKEWKPAEKAEFITALIEGEGLDYETVRKRIGSKQDAVRRHYITFCMLRQMEGLEGINLEAVEDKFSVLYLSLRTKGAQDYLQVDIHADPTHARVPVPNQAVDNLVRYARWMFGDDTTPPLFTDSRKVDQFSKILQSSSAVEYLQNTKRPNFELAFRKAGGDELEVAVHLETAADEIEAALSTVHHHTSSRRVRTAVKRLSDDADALKRSYPL